ncbi:MAG: AmmeMemoRadiSam system protein B [Bacteroidales bacterium]
MNVRKATVAGQFYPGNKKELDELLEMVYNKEKDNIDTDLAKKKIIGGIAPHAGYMFSAYQAVHLFDSLKHHTTQFDTFFIINPNHTGMGNEMAFDSNDYWETPYGNVEVDKDFIQKLNIPVSDLEEKKEHSGEVMVPMLRYFLNYDFKIAPVTMTLQNYRNAANLANQIFKARKELDKQIFIIASSDFSHFVTPKKGEQQDQYVLDKIMEFDCEGIEKVVSEKQISVCGYGPIMAVTEYARLISDNPKTKILRKGNSGDIITSNEVVDYVSMLFYEE